MRPDDRNGSRAPADRPFPLVSPFVFPGLVSFRHVPVPFSGSAFRGNAKLDNEFGTAPKMEQSMRGRVEDRHKDEA